MNINYTINSQQFVGTNQTGQFYPISNPTGYVSQNIADLNYVHLTGVDIVSGTKTFKGGVSVGTGSLSYFTSTLNPIFQAHRNTGNLQGVQASVLGRANYALNTGEIVCGVLGYVTQLGANYNTGFGEHCIGTVGLFDDTISGKAMGVGVEGRVNASGIAPYYMGTWGFATWGGTNFSGTLVGIQSRVEITTAGDGTPALNSGTAVGVDILKIQGGMTQISVRAYDPMYLFNSLNIFSTGNTSVMALYNDGADGNILSNFSATQNLRLAPGTNGYLVLQQCNGFVPIINDTSLGNPGLGLKWRVYGTSGDFATALTVNGIPVVTGLLAGSNTAISNNGNGTSTISVINTNKFTALSASGTFNIDSGLYRYIWSGQAIGTGILPSPTGNYSGIQVYLKNKSSSFNLTISGNVDNQQNDVITPLSNHVLWSDGQTWNRL